MSGARDTHNAERNREYYKLCAFYSSYKGEENYPNRLDMNGRNEPHNHEMITYDVLFFFNVRDRSVSST